MTEQEAIDYFNNATIDTRIGLENMTKTTEIINISIKALEKQIPKKVILNNKYEYNCPNCKRAIGSKQDIDTSKLFKSVIKFCNCCGQAIKWE